MTDADDLAIEAYVYGFPLVFNLEQVIRFTTTGVGGNPAAPFNVWSHARSLSTAADTFVSINNDTVYSIAMLDLSVGPIRLHVPESDRYYVLQFVDAWTDNFAYIGTRATGQAAGDFLIVPPGWMGDPGGLRVIHAPSPIATIVGRWAVAGVDDLPAVHRLQDALALRPLDESAVAVGVPATDHDDDAAVDFWEKYRVWSQSFPPAARDVPLQESFAPLGLTGDAPVRGLDGSLRAVLGAGYAAGKHALETALASGSGSGVVNGWSMTLHVFDYNLDYFEIGALDDAAWKIGDPRARILGRAGAALGGLWGNHGYEAAYLMTYVDADGEQLTGAHEYELTLSPPPPVGAFWSVTMYSLPDFYLVPNEINRYSIGDRTPGTVRDEAGGITIRMSRTRPADPDAAANWLPTPEGGFRPLLRMYMPGEAVLDGTYAPPAVIRLG